jgi:prepilin-type N-terminal cleavage/methylation domain-containing protein
MVRLADLRRDERGFSLIELLAAMAIGSIVLTGLMLVFINGLKAATQVNDRVESSQRGRIAMDRVVTLLDSQVCTVVRTLNPAAGTNPAFYTDDTTAPIVPTVSTGTSVRFYADLTGASDTPDLYQVTYDATAKTLTEYRYKGSGTIPNRTYPATPSTSNVLLTDAAQARDSAGNPLPVFQYFAFQPNGTVDTTQPLATVDTTTAKTVIRVGVEFQATPNRTRQATDRRRSILTGEASLSTADPDPSTRTTCP